MVAKTLIKMGRMQPVVDYAAIIFGCFLVALGLDLFLIPNRITAGGVSGISTILFHLLGVPVGLSMLGFNSLLFLIALMTLGREFGLRSAVATVALSFMVDGIYFVAPLLGTAPDLAERGITQNVLLATIFGDILTGAGMALVFLKNSSTGGTDILARILNKYTEIPIGRSLMMIDALVTVGAGFVFGAEMAMFAIIAIFVNSKTIDFLIQGMNQGKKFLIISRKYREIADDIIRVMGRGATLLNGVGAFSGEDRPIILVVIRPRELPRLKSIVRDHDPDAFVMVSEVYEIMGEGFRRASL
ncbi:MAG TPA: YitT family protein [Acidobacteriota bacterium]|nr:YitT family protein [Acidobacteriota bacterium]HQF86307.1 YitT family protein [Acidobacteriota bacterium]HQG90450.1 YitT family protein [Acidobacteriota bacterium]